ncbi:unnamed protein product [Pipistrellus nathusii]|uniref:Uncharacterized protein n=1 Tax=Pipistrellus nathusii TaxID=59473 RepID=A0ABN9ZX45_PIPNA
MLTTMQVTSHCHPLVAAWPAALTVSLHTRTYNPAPGTLSPSCQAHWEGGTRPSSQPILGPLSCPVRLSPSPNPPSPPCQPLATNPGVSDTIPRGCSLIPHSLLTLEEGRWALAFPIKRVGGDATRPLRALHPPACFPPL